MIEDKKVANKEQERWRAIHQRSNDNLNLKVDV